MTLPFQGLRPSTHAPPRPLPTGLAARQTPGSHVRNTIRFRARPSQHRCPSRTLPISTTRTGRNLRRPPGDVDERSPAGKNQRPPRGRLPSTKLDSPSISAWKGSTAPVWERRREGLGAVWRIPEGFLVARRSAAGRSIPPPHLPAFSSSARLASRCALGQRTLSRLGPGDLHGRPTDVPEARHLYLG